MKAFKKLIILLLLYLFSSCNTEEHNITIFVEDSLVRNWDIEKYFSISKNRKQRNRWLHFIRMSHPDMFCDFYTDLLYLYKYS